MASRGARIGLLHNGIARVEYHGGPVGMTLWVTNAEGKTLCVAVRENEAAALARLLTPDQTEPQPGPTNEFAEGEATPATVPMSPGQLRDFIELVMRDILDREVGRRVGERMDEIRRVVTSDIVARLRA